MPTQRHGTEKMCEGTQYPFAWWQRFAFRILAEVWQQWSDEVTFEWHERRLSPWQNSWSSMRKHVENSLLG